MKLEITYPQIVFETKIIDITEDQYEELQDASIKEQASFVFHQLNDIEQSWTPSGKQGILNAMDLGYCQQPKVVRECPSTITIITPNGH